MGTNSLYLSFNSAAAFSFVCAVNASSIFGYLIQTITIFANSSDYADVYKFYDDKVAEYLKQYGDPYGIFKDDTTLVNREKIISERTLKNT